MTDNLKVYNKVRSVPPEAQKQIRGGRLKGFTDINPMWRIKTLTEQFGVCGVGWYIEIVEKWIETSMAKDEITANVLINLYIKIDGEWSKPIQGIGGSMLIASEKGGLYVDDECYKKALTDAISVSCKSLGMGADVYWDGDRTKYSENTGETLKKQEFEDKQISSFDAKVVKDLIAETGTDEKAVCKSYKVADISALSKSQKAHLVKILEKRKENQETLQDEAEEAFK